MIIEQEEMIKKAQRFSAFLLTPCTHQYLDVARYAFDIDVHNLSKTNTELTSFLMTD